jgi:hypothetical protein
MRSAGAKGRLTDVGAAQDTRFVLVALVIVGIVLIVFGGLVLLRFPTRPGGEIEFQGLRISSVGAGLPLIVLGLAAVVVAGILAGSQPTATPQTTPPPTTPPPVSEPPSPSRSQASSAATSPSCLDEHLGKEPTVRPEFRKILPEGQTTSVVGPTAALVLTRNAQTVAAVRLQYFPIGGPQVTVIDVVDATCQPGTSETRKSGKTFVITLALADQRYEVVVDYGESLSIPKATFRGPAAGP